MPQNGAGLLVGRGRVGDHAAHILIDPFFQMAGQRGILGGDLGVIGVVLGRGVDERAQRSVAALDHRGIDGVTVARDQVPGDKQLAGLVEIGHHAAVGGQGAQIGGGENRGGRAVLHLNGDGLLIQQVASLQHRLCGHIFQKNLLPQAPPAGVDVQIPPPGGGVPPAAAGVFVLGHSPQQGLLGGLYRHDRVLGGLGLAAQLAAAHGIIAVAAQREHVAGLGKEQVVGNGLLQIHGRLMQRPQHHVLSGGDQQPQRHQHRRHGQHLKQIAFFMGTLGDQEQQRHQRGGGVPEEALLAHAPQAEKHHHHHGGGGDVPHAPGGEGVADHGSDHGQQQRDLGGEQQRRGRHAVKVQ